MADFQELLDDAIRRVAGMTPEEKEAMLKAQRESWARGEAGIGNDRQEAADRARWREKNKPT